MKQHKSVLKIVTAVVEQYSALDNKARTELLEKVIDASRGQDIVLLPAGYFQFKDSPEYVYDYIVNKIKAFLKGNKNLVVVIGLDCEIKESQMAIAVNYKGIMAIGRKVSPTADEKGKIKSADGFFNTEHGYNRIFKKKGKRLYLAVCYDVFGIKHQKVVNPNVDIVLGLVHDFYPLGKKGSGDVYFAKNVLAGCSKHWNVPVFGSVVYIRRVISKNFPTGVFWNQGNISTQFWRYDHNPIYYHKKVIVKSETELAELRFYKL